VRRLDYYTKLSIRAPRFNLSRKSGKFKHARSRAPKQMNITTIGEDSNADLTAMGLCPYAFHQPFTDCGDFCRRGNVDGSC
jgi:hypothetical protein